MLLLKTNIAGLHLHLTKQVSHGKTVFSGLCVCVWVSLQVLFSPVATYWKRWAALGGRGEPVYGDVTTNKQTEEQMKMNECRLKDGDGWAHEGKSKQSSLFLDPPPTLLYPHNDECAVCCEVELGKCCWKTEALDWVKSRLPSFKSLKTLIMLFILSPTVVK